MIVKLPALEMDLPDESGNVIRHKIATQLEGDFTLNETSNSYIVIGSGQVRCCLTVNEDNVNSDCDRILLTKRRPSFEGIQRRIEYKRWLKHPKLSTHTPDSVRASWSDAFKFVREEGEVPGLRIPQVGAIHSALGHLSVAQEIGTIVLPTGTGKTETMLSILVANRCQRVLVVVPSDPLRKQIGDKFMTLGYLKQFGIVNAEALNPIVGVLTKGLNGVAETRRFFLKCNVIIATMNIVASSTPQEIEMISELCSHLFVDEAHHSKAHDWDRFITVFKKSKVLLFTATPYRNDGQRLEGKIIFNFSLRDAQQQGYFKRINFLPVRQYDSELADYEICEKAVQQLRQDIANGFPHILMARCANKERAERVFQLYRRHEDLKPVLIHSTIPNKGAIFNEIQAKEHSIIVCVDMLGEGFDLPELKIAAFHDVRKSLPITLQFAGRFTRTSYSLLGEASFIANLYQPNVQDELSELYAQDSDWNALLPQLSGQNVQDQIDFKEFLEGFNGLNESKIPFQNICPALSTVVYRNVSSTWAPNNYKAGIKDFEKYDHKFSSLNSEAKILVLLLGRKTSVEWGHFSDVYNFQWDIIIAYWETRKNLLFIHGSEKSGHYQALADALLGEGNANLLSGVEVFRVFHNINRLALFNVGLRKLLGRNLSFQSYYGRSVAEALGLLDTRQGIRNNVFGIGYEAGEKVSLGCSQKGRVWSYARGNIREWSLWCKSIGNKLIDPRIDPATVLKGTLIPRLIARRPHVMPISVDWDPEFYASQGVRLEFRTQEGTYNLSNCELSIHDPNVDGELNFSFVTEDFNVPFIINLSERREGDRLIHEYKVQKQSTKLVNATYGSKNVEIQDLLQEYAPVISFADGSSLVGNHYVELNEEILPISKENIIAFDWRGVNLSHEGQGVDPKVTDSIQYAIIRSLCAGNYQIVYDDDQAGEIADVIAIEGSSEIIEAHLFHLKWAQGGVVSNQIKNLYEICGQVQKSIHWKFRESKHFLDHLLRRKTKKKSGRQCSRLEKGTVDELERLLREAKFRKAIRFHVYLVQPAISKANASADILKLLGVTANFLKQVADIELKIIGSD